MERAAKVGPERLLPLLDESAVAMGTTRWSDDHLKTLSTKDRKVFKKHYETVGAAVGTRSAYLEWLIGAVCNTPAGLERVIEVLLTGTAEVRTLAAKVLLASLSDPASQRRVADALDLRTWDGRDRGLEMVYRVGVVFLAQLDPEELYARYAPLTDPAMAEEDMRFQALFYGLYGAKCADPRWAAVGFRHMASYERAVLVFMVLEHLPADASWVEPLCAVLPKPCENTAFWNGKGLDALARAADARAIPWLVGALQASWMNWPAVMTGFRRVGDPAMAHVVRDWDAAQPPSGRNAEAAALIAELERNGTAPPPNLDYLVKPPEPPRTRTTLTYAATDAFDTPALDSLETVRATYQAAFEQADLADDFERVAKPAVWMVPTRVDEETLTPGGTKLGGHPDLPKGTKWPRVKGSWLAFVAQINLADAAEHLPAGALPDSGLLSFFVGLDPAGKAGYCETVKVLHTPAGVPVLRQAAPKDYYDALFQAATVRFHATLRLPSPNNKQLTKLLKGKKLERYEEDVYDDSEPILPQLLGYRDHGYDAEEPSTSELLLQLPGDTQTDMEFGDGEVLGFYIHQAKLATGDFGKVWPRLGD